MLSLIDCIGLSQLDEDEIQAIAAHEHVPDVIAIELAEYMIQSPDGVPMIKRIIIDDIERAQNQNKPMEVEKLRRVLHHFIATHPDYSAEENA